MRGHMLGLTNVGSVAMMAGELGWAEEKLRLWAEVDPSDPKADIPPSFALGLICYACSVYVLTLSRVGTRT